jgi:outer membrane lipoprotein-sorting protein
MRVLSALLILMLLGAFVYADDAAEAKPEPAVETVDELLKRIEAAHKEHKDFQGKFEQTRFLPLFGDSIKSSGRFVFKKPDQVRWEYTAPHKSILVVQGERGRKWSESTRRVEAFRLADDRGLDAVVTQLFTWFKGEFTKLKDSYEVEIKSREPLVLSMTPKSEALQRFIAAIEVSFSQGQDYITSVKLIEPERSDDEQAGYTLYAFTDTRLDAGVKDAEFEIRN